VNTPPSLYLIIFNVKLKYLKMEKDPKRLLCSDITIKGQFLYFWMEKDPKWLLYSRD
jgi:hypothetical protein